MTGVSAALLKLIKRQSNSDNLQVGEKSFQIKSFLPSCAFAKKFNLLYLYFFICMYKLSIFLYVRLHSHCLGIKKEKEYSICVLLFI